MNCCSAKFLCGQTQHLVPSLSKKIKPGRDHLTVIHPTKDLITFRVQTDQGIYLTGAEQFIGVWLEYEMSPTGSGGPQLVVLFGEAVETVGGGVSLEEVGQWGRILEGYT
jgi:hypothetical protein